MGLTCILTFFNWFLSRFNEDFNVSYDIFISYRREGGLATAENLADILRRDWKYQVFRDEESIDGGKRWQNVIKVALDSARCIVVLLSQGCLERTKNEGDIDIFRQEIEGALELESNTPDVLILPFCLKGFKQDEFSGVPATIQKLQQFNFMAMPNQKFSSMARDVAIKVGVNDHYIAEKLIFLRAKIQSFLSENDEIDLYEMAELLKFKDDHLLPDARVYAVLQEEKSKKLGLLPEPRIQPRLAPISTVAPSRLLVALEIADQLTQQFGAETCNQIRAAMGLSADKAKFSVPMVMDLLVEIGFITPKSSPNVNHQLTEAGRRFGSEDGLILRWKNEVVALLIQKAKEKIVTLKEEVKQVPVPIVEQKPVVEQPLKPVVPLKEEIQQQAPAPVVEEKPVVQQSKPVFPIKLPVETLTYDQLVKLVISTLGKEKCEEVRAAMGLEVRSTSFMVIHVLKEIGILYFLEDNEEYSSGTKIMISEFGKNFCIEEQISRREALIQWKSEIFSLIIEEINKFCPVDLVKIIDIPPNYQGNSLSSLESNIIKKTGDEDIRKLCLIMGWDTDANGIGEMIQDVIFRINIAVHLGNYHKKAGGHLWTTDGFGDATGSLLTDEGCQYGYEIMGIRSDGTLRSDGGCLVFKKKIVSLILKFIEEKIDSKITISVDTLKGKELIRPLDIADFLYYQNLSASQRKSLFLAINGRNCSKPDPELVIEIVTKMGFIKDGYDEVDWHCLTKKGMDFCATTEYVTIDLKWNPEIVYPVCSYFREIAKDYDGIKEGDFLSLQQVASAVPGPRSRNIKEKTGSSIYVKQSDVEEVLEKNMSIFSQFYIDKPGPNRWNAKVVPFAVDYISKKIISGSWRDELAN